MEFSNQKRARTIKLYFNLISVSFILVAVWLIWLGKDMAALFVGLGFAAYITLVLSLNLCYVSFSTEKGKVLLRYYPIVAFFGREYSSVEFPQYTLLKFILKDTFLFSELILIVKTRRGAADYPEINLGALTKDEIALIRQELSQIVERNQSGYSMPN